MGSVGLGKLHDVVVVGAGPAGASAARALAAQGVDVLVLERRRWPRTKLCGGGLTPKAYLQIASDIEDLVRNKCNGVYLRAGESGPFHLRSESVAIWMVDREELDVRLLQRAREAGARFADDRPVRSVVPSKDVVAVVADGETYLARVVVGADGVDSVVAKDVGLRRRSSGRYGLALQATVKPEKDALGTSAVVDFGIPYGYAWVFPKGRHYSVGVGTWDARRFKELPRHLDRFIGSLGFGSATSTKYRGHKLAYGGYKERLSSRNVLLVGDAAGLADPLFGEGISYSLKSGQMGADVIVGYLCGELEGLDAYTEKVHQTILKDLSALRRLAFFVHRLPVVAVRLLSASQWLQYVIAGIVSGERSYSHVW